MAGRALGSGQRFRDNGMDALTLTRPALALMAAFLGAAAPATAQDRPDPRPGNGVASAPAQDPAKPAPRAPDTSGLAGPFMAARLAVVQNDFKAAARLFVQTLAHDPGDPFLQDSTLMSLVSAGDVDQAAELARRIAAEDEPTELSGLIEQAAAVYRADWTALLADLGDTAGPDTQSDLLLGMMRGWALLGAGRASEALAEFERLATLPGVAPMVNYHLALARAQAGDFEGAATLLAEDTASAHLMGFVARAQVLAQLDRRDEAVAVLDTVPGIEAEPQLVALRDALKSGQPVAFDVVKTPADGIAQVFLTFAAALAGGPEPEPLSLIHARLAAWLAPDMAEARLMVAQILQDRGQFDLAEPEFEALRRMGQMRPGAELVRIGALSDAKRFDEAGKAALALTAAHPDLPQAWVALGDVLRRQENFTQAVPAYDKALALLADAPPEARWFALYARGIALERAGQFDRAEADLLAAVEIRPDDASLLNYLGYSWIDRNKNLDRGLAMIEKAVSLAPDDGYVLDSLAWAYYRLGRYDEAVAPMERAILTMSADPLVNDHLGDIYWKVGRQREAEIQWQRALSLDPAETADVDPDRIRAKLDRGLDAILAEEAAGTTSQAAPAQTEARN